MYCCTSQINQITLSLAFAFSWLAFGTDDTVQLNRKNQTAHGTLAGSLKLVGTQAEVAG